MIALNLVSSGQRKEIKLRRIYGFIKTVNLAMVIIVIIIAIILLVAKMILQSKFNEVVDQTTLVTKTNQGYNNNVREINSKLNYVEKIQDEFILWSDLIKNLAKMTPSDINLSYFKLNYEDKTVQIKGNAELRSSLLEFKNKIELFKKGLYASNWELLSVNISIIISLSNCTFK